MKKVFAVVCTLVLVSQPFFADENPGKPEKGKSSVASVSEASSADAAKLPIRRAVEQEMEDRQKDIDRIVDDQGRLRENMKALRGSAEEKALLQRYTKQLDDQETLLAALRKKIQDTEAQRDSAQTQLETIRCGHTCTE
jgi:chromosome segregation ATPase